MAKVDIAHLELGHMFPSGDVVHFCLAEEANLCGIYITLGQSNFVRLCIFGRNFDMEATHSEAHVWKITVCYTPKDDKPQLHLSQEDINEIAAKSPYLVKWLAPLMTAAISEMPAATNKMLKHILSAYGKMYAITESMMQDTTTSARVALALD
jgi:hypothetical protein